MITFYIKEALRIFNRSPFASVVIISVTTIAILMTSFSILVIQLSNKYSQRIKKSIEVTVFLENFIDSSRIQLIHEEILNQPNIASIKFISKEEAVKEFIRDTGEDFRDVLTENPLPPSFIIKFKPEKISYENIITEINRLKSISGITDVVYDNEFIIKILKYLKSGQVIVYIFSVLLILLSIYLVYTNSRIQIESNKNLYQTMKLVGAKLSTIKIPIILYGILIGIISGIICIGINYILELLLITLLNNIKLSIVFKGNYIIALLTGIILGFIGSYFSSRTISLTILQEDLR
ncbi:MAG: permease-like cell division protein FtsX [Melioribacter sp.]|uniref:cell division protein FtsX n=1 Tax=Rosettibacter primus TaxID=3111523 RepID=UPI00247C696B|nr:permease-like cell division protein FtsX [Melioribacter sp.]